MADSPGTEQEDRQPWVNPYTAQVLYHTLRQQKLQEDPTDPMFSPEEIEFRRAQNAYNQRVGGILSMSGDKRVSDYGGGILKQAMDAAKVVRTEHGEYDPISGQHRYFPDYLRQRDLDRTESALNRSVQLEAGAEATHERQRIEQEFKRPLQEAQAGKTEAERKLKELQVTQGRNVDAPTKKTLEAVGQTWDELKSIRKEFSTRNYKPPAGGWSRLGAFQDWMASENPQLAPKDWVEAREMQGLFTKLATLKARHETFGAVLPPGERKDWSITEPPRGASKAQMKQWFDKQIELIERSLKFGTDAAVAGNFNRGQIEGYTRGYYTAPPGELSQGIQATPQAPAPQPGAPGLFIDANGNLVQQ